MYRKIIYDNYLSTGYSQLNRKIDLNRSFLAFDLNFTNLLPISNDNVLLEIGCGMGHFQEFLRCRGYSNRVAIDIGPEQIGYCQENFEGEYLLVKDTNIFLQNHPRFFDCIIMNDVIEHFTKNEIVDILQRIKRSLKDSGKFIMRTPNMAAFFCGASRYGDFTHEVGFTERSIQQLLLATGFEQVECFPEKSYIRSRYKRILFSFFSRFLVSMLKAIVFLERPGGNYPKIFSKNLIVTANNNGSVNNI
ncbi:MAG: class I SAM-dependent methyltransferase [Candidatus Electrothrix sp. AR3]|nr:class I SAM-dependent methyltransferase [Candidatus Electrothrix sp. AR3]